MSEKESKMYTVEALFFPTRIILIDDDQDFLISVSRHLKKFFQVDTFSDPRQALTYILENQKKIDLFNEESFISRENQDVEEFKLDLMKINVFVKNKEKYNFPTIIISDYEMNDMTGLQLFEKLDKTSMMRFFLTGKADLKLAVEAFNRGLVDKFLIKDTEKIHDEIIMNIRACQHNFFSKISYPILSHLNIPIDSLLNKIDFSYHFMKIVQENEVLEYYLIDNIGSFLLITKNEKRLYFIVMLDRQFDEYLNVAVTSRAPNEIIDGLKNRTDAPTFISEADYNLSAREWRHITQTFEKKGEYYFVLINQST